MCDECMICLEYLEKNIVILSCGHKYHYKCIQDWMKVKKQINRVCTICDEDNEILNIEKYEELHEIPKSPSPKLSFINTLCCNIL